MKSTLRPALKFFLAFLLLYTALTGLGMLPPVMRAMSSLYQKPTQPILSLFLSKAYLQLRSEVEDPALIWVEYASKQQVNAQMQQAGASGQQTMSVQGNNTKVDFNNLFLTFFLFFISLMILSPLSLKSKLWKMLAGAALLYLYTVFKMWLALLNTFNQPEIGIYHLGNFSSKLVQSTASFLSLGINLLVVLLLWLALVFDKTNWKAFISRTDVFFKKVK